MSARQNELACPKCGSGRVTRHTFPIPARSLAEQYAANSEDGYRCSDCAHQETVESHSREYSAFRERWNDIDRPIDFDERRAQLDAIHALQDQRAREFTWPVERWERSREQRAVDLAESRSWNRFEQRYAEKLGKQLGEHPYGFPVGEQYTQGVMANPDADEPRLEYARWLRGYPDPRAKAYADFIEFQIQMAQSWRDDPKCDPRKGPDGVLGDPEYAEIWWRAPGMASRGSGRLSPGESTTHLEDQGLIAQRWFYRGFVEHVAIKVERFLEIADELFALAPIRHLTLTYTKGRDHQDAGLWRALLESPHLERIRSLRMPKRIFGKDNDYTELNRFSDGDIALLAQTPRLAGLRVLDLEDQGRLTWRAFDALAESRCLPALSHVKYDLFSYGGKIESRWGLLGETQRFGPQRRLHDFVAELERRHGHIVWLHPVDYYGSEDPDIEAVTEHPVALTRKR